MSYHICEESRKKIKLALRVCKGLWRDGGWNNWSTFWKKIARLYTKLGDVLNGSKAIMFRALIFTSQRNHIHL